MVSLILRMKKKPIYIHSHTFTRTHTLNPKIIRACTLTYLPLYPSISMTFSRASAAMRVKNGKSLEVPGGGLVMDELLLKQGCGGGKPDSLLDSREASNWGS